ncbi:universal stress protein [Streptosporangiaceae bacterium NEAU-GS5]|nr:universal stress protein [Streptosporangiaceae bacterium NEAU-GS5]
MSDQIVVGVDGSPAALSAVEWAAADAARIDATLKIVYALDRSPYEVTRSALAMPDQLTLEGTRVVAAAAERARERHPWITVTTEVREGHPAKVLRDCAMGAAEVVVGSRGLGGFARALLGSVSIHVAGQAACPVVVVRAGEREPRGEVVVGIDDGPDCEPAIAYAFEQAARRGVPLRAVYAWRAPVHVYAPEVAYDMDEITTAQHHMAKQKLTPFQEKHPRVQVAEDVRCAHPVDALVDAAEGADLVVVGSHGRGAFGSMLLGSVGHGVLHHTSCPVAVVPADERR